MQVTVHRFRVLLNKVKGFHTLPENPINATTRAPTNKQKMEDRDISNIVINVPISRFYSTKKEADIN